MALDIEQLYKTHGPMVLRRCRRLLKDENKAVDAMHDVFVEMLRRQDALRNEAPAGLLLTAATNLCLNRLRSEKRRPGDQPAAESDPLEQIAAATAKSSERITLARRILQRIFGNQPESTALIAVLIYVDGLTLEETAREVGLSVSGVRKRLRTLKTRLPDLREENDHKEALG